MRIFRVFFLVVLNITLLTATFPKTLIWVDYYLDTETYAAYCINSDKPQLGCNGKCQMTESMKNMDKDNQRPVFTDQSIVILYTIPELFYPQFQTTKIIKELSFPLYKELVLQAHQNIFLRPPQKMS